MWRAQDFTEMIQERKYGKNIKFVQERLWAFKRTQQTRRAPCVCANIVLVNLPLPMIPVRLFGVLDLSENNKQHIDIKA